MSAEGTWMELYELQKFVEMFDLDIPQQKIVELANKISTQRIQAEQKCQLLQNDVLRWIQATEELAEHVDMEVQLTSENELVRKLAKEDFDLEEKLRWKRSLLKEGRLGLQEG